MTTEHRKLVRDVVDVFVENLQLPPKFVRQIIAALKARNRIDSGRPVSPEPTPRAIARTLLALTSSTIRDAVDTEQRIGALNLAVGVGQPTLEDELTDLVETAVGWRFGDIDFRDGSILVGEGRAIINAAHYRGKPTGKTGLQRFTLLTNRAVAQISRELLPAERGAA
ncbi:MULTISPECIES: hypothetical protein [unclassified Mesorhizobium]|uniref:hypothetical protein n=1 Tax=unclassified Mesorhizobium TaxID=325217 RepID=UPI00301582A8